MNKRVNNHSLSNLDIRTYRQKAAENGSGRATDNLRYRAKQQRITAKFGLRILTSRTATNIIDDALKTVTKAFLCKHATFKQYIQEENKVVITNAVGFPNNVINKVKLSVGKNSLAGFTLLANAPIIVKDLNLEKRFSAPGFLKDAPITSAMTVIVQSGKIPFGVLGVYSVEKRTFTKNDISFIQTIANSLASAMERERIDAALRKSEEKFRSAMIRDITQAKDEERRRDHFLGIASHELRNTLASVKSFTQLLERKLKKTNEHSLPLREKTLDYVRRIDTNTDRLKRLIDDLMDMTKIKAGRLELVKEVFVFNQLLLETVEDFRNIAKNHVVILDIGRDGVVHGDKMRLRQVMTNILKNAAKYSNPESAVSIRAHTNETHIKVSIVDQGVGISKRDQKRIFDLFYRAENADTARTTGMGVGLYISSEIIKMHGGTMTVESKQNVGSTFSFTLPLVKKKK